ncbi:MAG TPA: hypothetical protein VF116_05635 [Ktedonobacterales bacterium]
MRYTSDEQRRASFRDWLRAELRRLDYYQRRGGRYLMSEFARDAEKAGAHVEEVSLGRYLRGENPVLPTPENCRELAHALGRHPAEVLVMAGYLTPDDFYCAPEEGITEEALRGQLRAIAGYTYLPEVIRAQMRESIELQLQRMAGDLEEMEVGSSG